MVCDCEARLELEIEVEVYIGGQQISATAVACKVGWRPRSYAGEDVAVPAASLIPFSIASRVLRLR
jgi:hypothetical protein